MEEGLVDGVACLPEDAAALAASAEAQALLAFWRSLRRGDLLPSRRDLDPAAIPRLLPHLAIWEALDGGADFRVRLAGTAVEATHGQGLKGLLLSAVASKASPVTASIPVRWESWRRCVALARPDFRVYAMRDWAQDHLVTDRLMVPLADDGVAVDHLLVGYFRREIGPR